MPRGAVHRSKAQIDAIWGAVFAQQPAVPDPDNPNKQLRKLDEYQFAAGITPSAQPPDLNQIPFGLVRVLDRRGNNTVFALARNHPVTKRVVLVRIIKAFLSRDPNYFGPNGISHFFDPDTKQYRSATRNQPTQLRKKATKSLSVNNGLGFPGFDIAASLWINENVDDEMLEQLRTLACELQLDLINNGTNTEAVAAAFAALGVEGLDADTMGNYHARSLLQNVPPAEAPDANAPQQQAEPNVQNANNNQHAQQVAEIRALLREQAEITAESNRALAARQNQNRADIDTNRADIDSLEAARVTDRADMDSLERRVSNLELRGNPNRSSLDDDFDESPQPAGIGGDADDESPRGSGGGDPFLDDDVDRSSDPWGDDDDIPDSEERNDRDGEQNDSDDDADDDFGDADDNNNIGDAAGPHGGSNNVNIGTAAARHDTYNGHLDDNHDNSSAIGAANRRIDSENDFQADGGTGSSFATATAMAFNEDNGFGSPTNLRSTGTDLEHPTGMPKVTNDKDNGNDLASGGERARSELSATTNLPGTSIQGSGERDDLDNDFFGGGGSDLWDGDADAGGVAVVDIVGTGKSTTHNVEGDESHVTDCCNKETPKEDAILDMVAGLSLGSDDPETLLSSDDDSDWYTVKVFDEVTLVHDPSSPVTVAHGKLLLQRSRNSAAMTRVIVGGKRIDFAGVVDLKVSGTAGQTAVFFKHNGNGHSGFRSNILSADELKFELTKFWEASSSIKPLYGTGVSFAASSIDKRKEVVAEISLNNKENESVQSRGVTSGKQLHTLDGNLDDGDAPPPPGTASSCSDFGGRFGSVAGEGGQQQQQKDTPATVARSSSRSASDCAQHRETAFIGSDVPSGDNRDVASALADSKQGVACAEEGDVFDILDFDNWDNVTAGGSFSDIASGTRGCSLGKQSSSLAEKGFVPNVDLARLSVDSDDTYEDQVSIFGLLRRERLEEDRTVLAAGDVGGEESEDDALSESFFSKESSINAPKGAGNHQEASLDDGSATKESSIANDNESIKIASQGEHKHEESSFGNVGATKESSIADAKELVENAPEGEGEDSDEEASGVNSESVHAPGVPAVAARDDANNLPPAAGGGGDGGLLGSSQQSG